MEAAVKIPMLDMVMCLADAVDMVSSKVSSHHRRVSFIAYSIASEMGLPARTVNNVLLAGLVHDVGALALKDRLDALHFEESPDDIHAERGYGLLKPFGPFAEIADIVRYHHLPWEGGRGAETPDGKEMVPLESHILHLADRISVLVNDKRDILVQSRRIVSRVLKDRLVRFEPASVDVFDGLAAKEYFWLDLISPSLDARLISVAESETVMLDKAGITGLSTLFGRVVDFRSRFTAVHTAGASASSERLAALAGMSDYGRWMMSIAGNLHDLGKLAVPIEVIEKPGKLTVGEYNLIKRHPFYTYRLLERLTGIEDINEWASFHHERMDGHGYPFNHGTERLSAGSRIMAVGDVFTALMEDRPYRLGMDLDDVMKVMGDLAAEGALDPDMFDLLVTNINDVDAARLDAQKSALVKYAEFSGCEED